MGGLGLPQGSQRASWLGRAGHPPYNRLAFGGGRIWEFTCMSGSLQPPLRRVRTCACSRCAASRRCALHVPPPVDRAYVQAGQHYVDIRSGRRGATVAFVGLFRLVDAATLGEAVPGGGASSCLYVRGSVRLDYATKLAAISFSKPRT